MVLREGDALAVLRHKQALRANLVESDTLAVLKARNRPSRCPYTSSTTAGQQSNLISPFTKRELTQIS